MNSPTTKGHARSFWGYFSLLLVMAPAVFFFIAVQHSAITVPFWDHCELIKFFSKYYAGTLTFTDLWSPQNHTRPLLYRVVMLFNGVLTDWDLSSEYIYLIGSFYVAFGILAATLWRVMGRRFTWPYLIGLAVLSILCFSPVSHNNHWWSMMTQLDFTNVLILAALVLISFRPRQWSSSLWACFFCWGASFTLTNGLFAFLTAIVVVQLAGEHPKRFNLKTLFWIVNLVVCLIIYLPGLPESPVTVARPSLWVGFEFVLAYLGTPLAFLINFPFKGMFDMESSILFTAPMGLLLLIGTALTWARFRKTRFSISQPFTPGTLLLISMTCFALFSAGATSLARAAADNYGAAAGNSSRYSLFSVYLLYGLVFFWAEAIATGLLAMSRAYRNVGLIFFSLFVVLGVRTYRSSIPVYHSAYLFNHLLQSEWLTQDKTYARFDCNIYPNAAVRVQMRADLLRLKIGPYRMLASEGNK